LKAGLNLPGGKVELSNGWAEPLFKLSYHLIPCLVTELG